MAHAGTAVRARRWPLPWSPRAATPPIFLGVSTGSAFYDAAMTERRAALIVNPAAGHAGDAVESLPARLQRDFALSVYETSADRSAAACAKAARRDGASLVIAAGGDGTISSVASALLGADACLGVLPLGTANSIAHSLGIPDDLEGAIEVLVRGEPTRIDAARANGKTMILLSAVGLHADTVGETPQDEKQRWGVLAYIRTGLKKLMSLEPFAVEIETEDQRIHCRAVAVTVANMAPPRTVLAQGPPVLSPDDGRLDLTIVSATTLVEAVATGLHLLRTAIDGEPAERDNVGFLAARRVCITTDPPQNVLIDGEEAGTTPLVVECLPRALTVMAPRREEAREAPPAADVEVKLAGLPELEVEPKR
ncbi:YegS/Rv2252/BmrU family lipid kinase [Sorangium sp. So ce726]|uniref:YegS/Rv2252/BmrU family lipid kinase n=1 Tax=Sorangium sp. So ce726 TaxID=3133319 RepID=UPI003F6395E3